jgi:hypothetical protein
MRFSLICVLSMSPFVASAAPCPTVMIGDTECVQGTGACAATLTSAPGMMVGSGGGLNGGRARKGGGCEVGVGTTGKSLVALLLLGAALSFRLRRRTR